jgi:hypothetical protein
MSNIRRFIGLAVTTWVFMVCFAVWLMFGVIGIPTRNELGLNGECPHYFDGLSFPNHAELGRCLSR